MALEAEMGADNIATIAERCDVCFIGMGKLNAFETTMKALAAGEYEVIVPENTEEEAATEESAPASEEAASEENN